VAVSAGCFVPPGGRNSKAPDDGPGSEPWGRADVSCSTENDCLSNEGCYDGVCQMKRCTNGPYASIPPLGRTHMFFNDREISVLDTTSYQNQFWVDGYSDDGSVAYDHSTSTGSTVPTDIAAGNILGTRPEVNVVAFSGSSQVQIPGGSSIDVGFAPVAIAAGDTDGDGVDEVMAVSATANVAVCTAAGYCNTWDFGGGWTGKDIASGDVDGDGAQEAVVLINGSGYDFLIAINAYKQPGEGDSWGSSPGDSLERISAAISTGRHRRSRGAARRRRIERRSRDHLFDDWRQRLAPGLDERRQRLGRSRDQQAPGRAEREDPASRFEQDRERAPGNDEPLDDVQRDGVDHDHAATDRGDRLRRRLAGRNSRGRRHDRGPDGADLRLALPAVLSIPQRRKALGRIR